ncbi:hypothetical protein N7G274_006107 [Stereocaulon virgatum]|uniref:Uncharacterized protein n=1 Tax=Stereocaulon virgatum TaxID=373712 RepID=A0ABR4A7X6_9LECA
MSIHPADTRHLQLLFRILGELQIRGNERYQNATLQYRRPSERMKKRVIICCDMGRRKWYFGQILRLRFFPSGGSDYLEKAMKYLQDAPQTQQVTLHPAALALVRSPRFYPGRSNDETGMLDQ